MRRCFKGFVVLFLALSCKPAQENDPVPCGDPAIFPDYIGVTVPVNVAPLNFDITQPGADRVMAVVAGTNGDTLRCSSGDRTVRFPLKKWSALLKANAGDSLVVTVSARHNGKRIVFRPFPIYVSGDSIDYGIVFRHIAPGYEVYSRMGIYERELSSFRQKPLYENTLIPQTCVNCHSFRQASPDSFVMHVRGEKGGTILQQNGVLRYLQTKTDSTAGAFSYPCWHPSGKYIVFSINRTFQSFHVTREDRVEVFDRLADIVVYDVQHNKVLDCGLLTTEDHETYPVFSADGRMLYFCSAPAMNMPADYKKLKYNLCRVSFNPQDGTFGTETETVIDAVALGKSIAMPVPSCDGRYIMFSIMDYGTFPINHREADLALLNMETMEWHIPQAINSNDVESYHSWSSNSRWVVFASRRRDGLFVHPYFAHISSNGIAGKPFMLPQRNPQQFYDRLIYSYNCPEFVSGPVRLDLRQLEGKANAMDKEQVGYESL